MNGSHAVCATIALACLAGCAGYENVDAKLDAEAVPDAIPDPIALEADPEQYRISVEIPLDDVTIDRGENLDVDALLDERTSFTASDFHLREVILVARSRRGGSAELLLDEWASGAVDIPEGTAESWYEVRIPAADVGEAGVEWVIDFTGALDLNLLVAVLEPRSALLAAATATVREVVVEDEIPADQPGEPLAEPSVEVVQSVEVVEPVTTTPTVVKEVAVVEQPVYRTQTVYRYVDRPVYRYRVSWIYDPARYYVFRDYGGWTYRYFPGTWDWRCYNPSFRLPTRHHHHHDSHRHRGDRHDGRRYERRDDRDDRRGGRDRRRGDRDRDVRYRDGDDRDRDRPGARPRGSESRAVVSRPSTLWRRVDPGHPRIHLATQRRAEPRVEEDRHGNPRLRAFQGTQEPPNSDRAATGAERVERPANPRFNPFQRRDSGIATNPSRTVAPPPRVAQANQHRSATDGDARIRSFERREARQVERRPTVTDTRRQPTRRPTVANRVDTPEPRQQSLDARTRAFQRRPEQRAPSGTASSRTTAVQQRPVVRENEARPRQDVRRSNPRTQVFQREADHRSATRSATRSAQPRATPESRRPARSIVDRQRSAEPERGNARTRAFQRRAEPRVVEPQRPRADPPRPQTRPRSTPPMRRQTASPPARSQRVAPSRNAPQRERPVQRAPVKPQQSDSASDARPDEGRRSNSRARAFERR